MRAPWLITVVLGASGAGKSSVAVPLATRYGVPVCAEDDIVTAVRALTTPEQQPLLHYMVTQPDMFTWPPAKIADHHVALSEALRPGLHAVIADHIESDAPMVLEGDYLLPGMVAGFGPDVRAVVVHEPDAGQLAANFAIRMPGEDHTLRAAVSAELDRRLVEDANRVGVPVVPGRPWHDVVDRVDAALHS